jgi:meso-butanediol dehydrogenase/(S,S)-butanediol dehydrogenase/diacetyl reductase
MSALAGKVAIVTGGGRGIGRAIVDRLVTEGAYVLTCGRSERPEDLAAGVVWSQGDVSDPAHAKQIVAEAQKAFGPVSILVNNAGVQIEKTLADSTDDDWEFVVGINCRGVFNMCRAFLLAVPETGGSIINLGSIAGEVADPSLALYGASKAFVHGLTRSIAVDYGPKVRCNAVRPGWIMTPMTEVCFDLAQDPSKAKADALVRHAAGRFGVPDDIADAVAWLASNQASFITGQCITIDGGVTAASPLQPGLS